MLECGVIGNRLLIGCLLAMLPDISHCGGSPPW